MKNMNLKKLTELIKKAKLNATNPKRPRYSLEIKNSIIELSNEMSTVQIKKEFDISESFITRLKKQSKNLSVDKKSESSAEFQFLQVDDQFNKFMKDDKKAIPAMKLTTNGGIIIEIFS